MSIKFKMREVDYLNDRVVFESQDYLVRIGVIKDDALPVYVVINKDTSVVEFAHEVLSLAKEWVEHFTERNHPEVKADAEQAASLRLAN